MKCAELDEHGVFIVRYRYLLHLQHAVFVVRYRYLLHLQHEVFVVRYRYLPSHKMHRFTINIQSESVRQIFHICTSLHIKCAEPDKHAVFVVRIVPYLTPKSNFPYEGYGHSFCSATISILSE